MRDFPSSAPGIPVFTMKDAEADGWTRAAIRHAVERRALVRIRRGIFAVAAERSADSFGAARLAHSIAIAAALLARQDTVASHCSAAVLHCLPLRTLPRRGCLTVRDERRAQLTGIHVHRAHFPERTISMVGQLRVTAPSRTIVDIARERGPLDALVPADAALRARLVTPMDLRSQLELCAGWPGLSASRAAVAFADGRSESPLETESRFRLAGLVPSPELQASIYADGAFLGRPDFFWPEFGVVGEADGLQKYDGNAPDTLRQEKLRQERFEQAGLIVVRWTHEDLADVESLACRLKYAFGRCSLADVVPTYTARLRCPIT